MSCLFEPQFSTCKMGIAIVEPPVRNQLGCAKSLCCAAGPDTSGQCWSSDFLSTLLCADFAFFPFPTWLLGVTGHKLSWH